MVLSAQELFAIEKMATAGMGNRKIATTLGLVDEAVDVSLKDTAQKHVIYTSSDTPWHATQTQTAPLTQTRPIFPKWALPDHHMGRGAYFSSPKNRNWAPATSRKCRKQCKNEGLHFERMHLGKHQFHEKKKSLALNNVHFQSIHWGF